MVSEKFRTNPYRKKLRFSLILMSFIPMIILGSFSYYITMDEMKKNMDNMVVSTVYDVERLVDNNLKAIKRHYIEILGTNAIDVIVTSFIQYSDYSEQVEAMDMLRGPEYLREYIKGYAFVNRRTNLVLSNRGMVRYSNLENREEAEKIFNQKGVPTASLLNYQNDIHSSATYHDSIDLSGVFFLFRLPATAENPDCFLIVNLDMESFDRQLNEKNLEYQVTIFDNSYKLFYSSVTETGNYFLQPEKDLPVDEVFVVKEMPEKRIALTKSYNTGLTYIVTYDTVLLKTVGKKIYIITVTLFILFVCLVLLTDFLGKRIYQPVSRLVLKVSDMDSKAEKTGDEFQVIEQGFSLLQENNEYMRKMLGTQKTYIFEILATKLLNGSILNRELYQYLDCFHYKRYAYYRVISLQILFPNEVQNQDVESRVCVMRIKEKISEDILNQLFLVPVLYKQSLVFLIGEDSEDKLEKKIFSIGSSLSENYKEQPLGQYQMGVSLQYQNLNQTAEAVRESIEAVRISGEKYQRNPLRQSYIFTFFEDMEQGKQEHYAYPVSEANQLCEAIDDGRKENAFEIVEKIIKNLYHSKGTLSDRKYYSRRLFIEIMEIPENAGIDVRDVLVSEDDDLIADMSRLYQEEDVISFFRERLIAPIMEKMQECRFKNANMIKEKVIEYITKSRGDITLVECAEKLKYSPNHISRVIRCEANMSFSDYVTIVKLEYAQKLLRETRLPVADIAIRLNYTNAQNFIRFFSKQVGDTPGNYRKKNTEYN